MPIKSAKSFGVKALGQGLGADGEAKDAEFNQVTTLLHADGSEGAGDTAELGTPNYKAFIDNSTSIILLLLMAMLMEIILVLTH